MRESRPEKSADPKSIILELKRKSIHAAMVVIPLWIYFMPPRTADIGLIIASMATIAFDVWRLSDNKLKRFFLKFFKSLIRRHEEEHLLGSTYFMIAALISVLIFQKLIAISALLFLVIGDMAAAVFGKKYGKPRYWGKSIEGSLACFLSCLIIGYIILKSEEGANQLVWAGALAAVIAEAVPAPMDDNMRVPIISGMIMQIVAHFS